MGNSAFFWYPDATTSGVPDLEVLDVGCQAGDIQEHIVREATTVVGGTGRHSTLVHGGFLQTRIIIEVGNDEDTAEKLKTLAAFLKDGNLVGFAFDSAKSYAYVCNSVPSRGVTTLNVGTNVCLAWSGVSAPTAGDPVAIQSPLPELVYQWSEVQSYTTGRIILPPARALVRTPSQSPVIVRHKYFYPCLRLAPDQRTRPLITNDHGFDWVFDATFVEDVYALSQLESVTFGTADSGGTIGGDSLGGTIGGDTVWGGNIGGTLGTSTTIFKP